MPNVWFEIEDEAQDAARRAMSQAWEGDTWCEKGSIRQDIKDIKEHLDRHNDSLHTMYEAINAVSRMTGIHKKLIDELKEKVEDND
jgi:hypothetical protein